MTKSTIVTRVLYCTLALAGTSAYGADFRAGAGKSEIQVTPAMLPLENLTTQHDPLTVRVLLMDDGRARSAIVVLEQPSVSDGTIAGVKAALTKLAKVSAQNAIIVATHTTSAPHANMGSPAGGARPPGGQGPAQGSGAAAFASALGLAAERAIAQANSSLQPAKVGFGIGATGVNVNRDLPTPRGWAYGSNSAGFSDRSMPVVRIDGANGRPVAVLMNVAVRSVVMDGSMAGIDGGRTITADLAGAAAHHVEKWYGADTVALFLMGAAVDQAPVLEANRIVLNADGSLTRVDIRDKGFALLDLLGERLGSEIVQAADGIKANASPTVQVERRTLKVPSQGRAGGAPSNSPVLSYTYSVGPELDLPVVLMRIGDIAIVGVQPELGSSLGAQIKERSPFPHSMVAVMVDGGAKYMVDAQSYDRFTNEARGSQFAQGSAAITVSGIEGLLEHMKAAESQ